MLGPLLEVEISKKCTPLRREAHFEVKSVKKKTFSEHFLTFRCRFAWLARGILHVAKSEQNVRVLSHFQMQPPLHYNYNYTYTAFHCTTLHYTTLHSTTLHYNYNYNYTTLHSTTLHYTTLHFTTLHYTPLHYITLHYTTLNYTTFHYTTLD